MIAFIIIGDIIICGVIAALIAWAFARQEDSKLDEAARIPLLSDEESWNADAEPPIKAEKE